MVEFVREALAEPGLTMPYRVDNWARVMGSLSLERRPHAVLALGRTPRSEAQFLLMRRPIVHGGFCFFTRTDDGWTYNSPADLTNRRVGVTRGYRYGAEFSAWMAAAPKSAVNEVGGDDPVVRHLAMLQHQRSDVILEDRLVMRWASRERAQPVREAGCLPVVTDTGSYVAVPRSVPDAAEWVKKLDAGLERLERNGRLKALLDRYAVPDEAR